MTPETLKTLKASIAKWERNAVAKTPGDYLVSVSNCPLCELFIENDCEGCPVFGETGRMGCVGTPYHAANYARDTWKNWNAGPTPAHEAARKEVEFLKSLLPGNQS